MAPTRPPTPSPPCCSFGGLSPERKAGQVLRTFFSFVAVKIVMAQMSGAGRGDLGAYNADGYATLLKFLEERPLRNDGDAWLAELMKEDEMLGERCNLRRDPTYQILILCCFFCDFVCSNQKLWLYVRWCMCP